MVLYGRGLPAPVVRENMFYASTGIAARALAELPQAMALLFDNDFKDVAPTGIDLDVHVTSAQKTATMTDADAPRDPVAPGGTVRVRVTVRPFRDEPRTEEIALAIPANATAGPAMLVVRGGGGALPGGATTSGAASSALSGAQGGGPRTLEDAIKAFETGDKNTDVVVELIGGTPAGGDVRPARPSAHWTTPWVVRGRIQIPIVITGRK
jgi:hypothetical protein